MATPTVPEVGRRTRAPRGQGAALGREIVAAAMDVIDESGAPGLTLRGLARTIGVSAPAIYAHFANVDAILLALAEQVFDDLAGQMSAAIHAEDRPHHQVRELCRAYLHYAQAHPGRYLVMFGGQWDATSAVDRGTVDSIPVAQLGRNVLELFIRAVEAGRALEVVGPNAPDDDGSRSDVSTFDDAVITWVFLHGYAHQRIVARAFPWSPAMTEQLLDRVAGPVDRA